MWVPKAQYLRNGLLWHPQPLSPGPQGRPDPRPQHRQPQEHQLLARLPEDLLLPVLLHRHGLCQGDATPKSFRITQKAMGHHNQISSRREKAMCLPQSAKQRQNKKLHKTTKKTLSRPTLRRLHHRLYLQTMHRRPHPPGARLRHQHLYTRNAPFVALLNLRGKSRSSKPRSGSSRERDRRIVSSRSRWTRFRKTETDIKGLLRNYKRNISHSSRRLQN